ncbi:DNA-binding protein, putative [Babesia ovata]|uniref:DNA-binding protein, putative n=1 Tax=Babesia ovata TaxID=189622 RepID=A0A2H6KIT6_9APIC|nr:DNA-binding protein, putative [Babesia ovata]GBE62896.1 DNA-binding protein, putative [Babesia ovata]
MADLRECVGEGRRCYVLRVSFQRQAAEVYQGHVGFRRVLLVRLEERWQGIVIDVKIHGVVREPAAPCEHLVDGARRPGEVRAEAFEELQEITGVCEGQAFFEVCVVMGLLNLLADQDKHVVAVALSVVAQLAVLQGGRGGDLVAAAVEECAELVACINLQVPPACSTAFAALLRQPGEGVAQCGQRGEKDFRVLLTFVIGELCAGVGGDVRTCELGGELCEPLHQAVQQGT